MDDITLQQLLEAGCHFGHKAERWHPRAADYIYTEKDGIHIIDLAKTKIGLDRAAAFVKKIAQDGGKVLFVGTKRQAGGIVSQEAVNCEAPYLTERWIGGFLTNWESVSKNIAKINRLSDEQKNNGWKKFPKHERTKLARYLEKLKSLYAGVLTLSQKPDALFIVDIKKEFVALREALRCEIPIVAMVDTNSDPEGVDYIIPANDDAVGSIQLITHVISQSYKEGLEQRQKEAPAKEIKMEETKTDQAEAPAKEKSQDTIVAGEKKKRGRSKKEKVK